MKKSDTLGLTPNATASTAVWNTSMEAEDFLKVPRCLIRLGRYDRSLARQIQPRHLALILALASRKFKDLPIRAKWTDLAFDLATDEETVRKWAYQLRKAGLLRIERAKRKIDKGDRRNKFYLDGIIAAMEAAHDRRMEERNRLRDLRTEG